MKILYSCLIVVLLTSTYNNSFSQTNQQNKELFHYIHGIINDYRFGSGFSFVVFKKIKNNVAIIQIESSNSISKHLLDSIFGLKNTAIHFKKLKKGTYCLPIIQNAANDNYDLIWANNRFTNIIGFDWPRFKLPENTFLLSPIVLNLTAPIIN